MSAPGDRRDSLTDEVNKFLERTEPVQLESEWAGVDLVPRLAVEVEPLPQPEILRDADAVGVFYRGRRHILSGEPESGKTWIALAAAVEQIAEGETVVWTDVDGMGEAEIRARLRLLGVADIPSPGRFLYNAPNEPWRASAPGWLLDEVVGQGERPPALVVIDSYTPTFALFGMDMNNATDVDRLDAVLVAPFIAAGAAVLTLDHLVKDPEARGRYSSGSGRKLGRADVHLQAKPIRALAPGRDGAVLLKVMKDRRGAIRARGSGVVIRIESDGNSIQTSVEYRPHEGAETSSSESWRPTELMGRVVDYLRTHGEASRRAIREGIGGRPQYALQAIDALVEDGRIVEREGSRGSRICALAEGEESTGSRLVPTGSREPVERLVPGVPVPRTGTGTGRDSGGLETTTGSRPSGTSEADLWGYDDEDQGVVL